MHPDRVVVGASNEESMNLMRTLYSPFTLSSDRFIAMDIRSAEMTKYAANAMLATKISFINEMANICEHVGADINQVRLALVVINVLAINSYILMWLRRKLFSKRCTGIDKYLNNFGYNPELIYLINQKNICLNILILSSLKIAVWGLSFKPGTDDMRQASFD